MKDVKIALKRALKDYEQEKQESIPSFDIYEWISMSLGKGYPEPTLRKWMNLTVIDFAMPDQLLAICSIIHNSRPIDILIAYLKAMKGPY